jgi:hypothetical protein
MLGQKIGRPGEGRRNDDERDDTQTISQAYDKGKPWRLRCIAELTDQELGAARLALRAEARP